MTEYLLANSLGERVQLARKARGMSARELAEAIGGNPSQSTIENIELGRKASIDVVQLLNIAAAVRIPVSYLLAPLGRPDAPVDLVGLSGFFGRMSVIEFDGWLAGLDDGSFTPSSLDERNSRAELNALRLWKTKVAEAARLETALALETAQGAEPGSTYLRSTAERLATANADVERLAEFLRSAGWPV